MKYFIVSDIHGSYKYAKILIDKYNELKCDKILLLGDILYHGPRNDLPEEYNPKEVIKLLNQYQDKIIAIKGNCDAEVDEMVLSFKINNSYDDIINGIKTHLEHGHHLDIYNGDAKIILYGHTHIPTLENKNNQTFINPGSISIPKANSSYSYTIWDNNEIIGYDIFNNINFKFKY